MSSSIPSSPVRIAASRNAKRCRSTPADWFMIARDAARGCAPNRATAAYSAHSARSPARRSSRVGPFGNEHAWTEQSRPSRVTESFRFTTTPEEVASASDKNPHSRPVKGERRNEQQPKRPPPRETDSTNKDCNPDPSKPDGDAQHIAIRHVAGRSIKQPTKRPP